MLKAMLEESLALNGPVAIRYPRDTVIESPLPFQGFEVGKAEVLRAGSRVVVFCVGPLCYTSLEAVKEIADIAVVDLRCAKPLDSDRIRDMVKTCSGRFIVVEDGVVQGGVGSAILEILPNLGIPLKFRLMGIPDRFVEHGGSEQLRERLDLDVKGIARAIYEIL
jgi:1-deoxy-D-xylulose-5-phosphate synthase